MEHESAEEFEDHLSEVESGDELNGIKHEPSSTTSPTSATSAKTFTKPPVHMQKRRRVTRACDECRRKKIKCDGKQPCTHCTVYSYECTYDQPSNRRRNPAPQYIENLEHRVHRAETLLHILIPNLDLNDPGIDVAVAQGWIPGAPGKGSAADAAATTTTNAQTAAPAQSNSQSDPSKGETSLESMVKAVAQIDLDADGNWDYHGHSSGLSFMRRMREQLGEMMGPDPASTPFVKSRPRSQVLDSPRSTLDSPHPSDSVGSDLPSKETARTFCNNTLVNASALLRIIHQPTFWEAFERIYSTPVEQFTNDDHRFLPLLYSTMALGCLFGRDEITPTSQFGYENAIQQGYAYFKAARQMMDIADCRDLMSVQAVVLMTQFMQSSAKLSQCYAYVGVALRSALRMGLHRSGSVNVDPVESETRKRVFWVIRQMDIYVGAMLGLPQTLSDDDIDQDLPTEVDDEYITREGILPMPDGHVSLLVAFNAHTRLVQILQKIVRSIYPIKASKQSDKSYTVPISAIREIEADLEQWKANLHPALTPSDTPTRFTRVQQLLRLAYAHAQVLLYRPFLHFVTTTKKTGPVDQRAYACAASYVNVSRNIVHITVQMRNKGLLNGAFWFIMYTCFFSILSLVYFAAENPDNLTTEAVMRDALEGKEVLASLAAKSMAADRCTVTLDGIFARLPPWMREGRQNPTKSKKRHLARPVTGTSGQQQPAQHENANTAQKVPQHRTQARSQTIPQPAAQSRQPKGDIGAWQTENLYSDAGLGNTSNFGVDFNSPSSATSAMNMDALMPDFANQALPDVSAMMFPGGGDEPFNYPNQPLTAFETSQQQQRIPNGTAFSSNQQLQGDTLSQAHLNSSQIGAPPNMSTDGRDDNLEAQFFALPPYMEQQQQRNMPQAQKTQQPQQQFSIEQLGDYTALLAQQQNFQQVNTTMPQSTSMNSVGIAAWPPHQQPGLSRQHQASNQQFVQQSGPQDIGGMYIQELFGGNEFNPVMQ